MLNQTINYLSYFIVYRLQYYSLKSRLTLNRSSIKRIDRPRINPLKITRIKKIYKYKYKRKLLKTREKEKNIIMLERKEIYIESLKKIKTLNINPQSSS